MRTDDPAPPGGSPPTTTHFAPLASGPGRSPNGEPPGFARFAPGEQPDSVLVAASLAASGWPVIPLRRHTRTPIGASGPRHCLLWHLSPEAVAATDEERIGLGTSWGVVLGEPNADGLRLVVLDTDTDAAEAALLELLDALGDEGRDWAAGTFTVRTTRGVHRYGVTREPLTTARHDDRPGLDLKGAGGYVVVPGCWHPSGTLYAAEIGPGTVVEFTGGHHPDGSVYLGLCDPDDDGPAVAWGYPLPLPAGLLDTLDWPRDDDENHGITEPAHPADESPSSSRRLTLGAAERRLAGLARSVLNAPEGQGNACLNWAAGVAAAICASTPDAVDPDAVRASLVAAYLGRPIPHRESATSREREARATVASGWRWGSAHPAEALADHREGSRHDDDNDKDGERPVTLHAVENQGESPEGAATAAAETDAERSPFVDLAAELAGVIPAPPMPEHLHTTDARALLYQNAVNRLFGDTESGKTWVLLAAVAEVLNGGGRAALIDADAMGWRRLVRRLLLLGVPLDVLADPERFRVVVPSDGGHLLRAFAAVALWSPDLVGLDAFGGLLALLRKSRNNPDDVAEAMLTLRVLSDSGACVVLLDHLAQSAESRRFGPSGTLEKGREVRGVSLRVERVRTYRPGGGGSSRLLVEKDTDGGVREHLPEVKGRREPVAGVFRLASVGDDPDAPGSLLWTVDPPTPEVAIVDVEVFDSRADAETAEKLSRALEGCGGTGWLSQTKASEAAHVRKADAGRLLDRLAAGGYVERRAGRARGSVESRSVRPYRDGDPLPDAVEDAADGAGEGADDADN